VFSSKLHDFLKPRSHILVEPIHDFHQPFLQTLVDAPNSRYHLRDWLYRDAVELSTYIKDGLLPEFGETPDSAQSNAPNHSILLLVNMARGKASRRENAGKLNSHYRILSFMNALRSGAGLHSRGPVRMLLWLDDNEKNALIPQTVTTRKKISLQLETYCHVEEIVGGGSRGKQRRETALDVQIGIEVAKRMRDRGITIPIHRQDEMQREVAQSMDPTDDHSQVSPILGRDWQKELLKLQRAFDAGEFPQYEEGPPGPHEVRQHKKGHSLTPEFRRYRQLRSNAGLGKRQQTVLDSLLQQEAEIDSIQTEILHKNPNQAEREKKEKEQDRIRDELKTTLDRKEPSFVAKFAFIGDDRRALALDPPLLMWDRREAEPLLAQEAEFHGPHKLALLDFRPLVPNPWPMTEEQTVLYDYLSTHMFYSGIQSLKTLGQLAPGAFEALAPKVPELRDPLKGGRYDIEELRARNLSPELLHKLTLAWARWPFRPSLSELFAQHDSSEGDPMNYPDSTSLDAMYSPNRV